MRESTGPNSNFSYRRLDFQQLGFLDWVAWVKPHQCKRNLTAKERRGVSDTDMDFQQEDKDLLGKIMSCIIDEFGH